MNGRSASRRAFPRVAMLATLFALCFCHGASGSVATATRPILAPAARAQLLHRALDPSLGSIERVRLIAQAMGKIVPSSSSGAAAAARLRSTNPTETNVLPVSGCGQWSEWFPDSLAFALWDHSMVYDAAGDRLLVFGGFDERGHVPDAVWALGLASPTAWTPLTTAGTRPPVAGATAIYDAARNRVIVFGGWNQTTSPYEFENRVWALNLSNAPPTWVELAPDGPLPPGRFAHCAVYDASRDRLVAFGGYVRNPDWSWATANDVWALALAPGGGWTQLTPAGSAPAGREGASAIYDALRDRMVIFGGMTYDAGSGGDVWDNQVYTLAFAGSGSWTHPAPGGVTPLPVVDHSAIFDSPRNRIIVFGGLSSDGSTSNSVYALSLSDSLSWSQLAPAGPLPSTTALHAAVYDPVRQRMMVFGGRATGDETWRLSLSGTLAWTQLSLSGEVPRERAGHSMIIDAPRNRLVLYGGLSTTGAMLSDVWTHPLSGPGAWTRIIAAGPRPQREEHAAVYDSVGQRMVVFGGYDELWSAVDETWALSLTGTPTWTQLSPSGGPPPGRALTGQCYDSARRRLVIFGGTDGSGVLEDLRALSLAGSGTWTELAPTGGPPFLYPHGAVYDSPRDQMAIVGQNENGYDDFWTLRLAGSGTWTHYPVFADQFTGTVLLTAYDRSRNRVLVLNCEGAGVPLGEVCAISLAGTPALSIVGHAEIGGALHEFGAMAVDPAGDRLLVFGGGESGPRIGNDLQALDFGGLDLRVLDVGAVPAPGGSVTVSPAGSCQANGSVPSLLAVPADGFEFTGWSGDAGGTANPLAVTMNANKSIRANFAQPPPVCDSWRWLLLETGTQPPLTLPGVVLDPVGSRLIAVGQVNSSEPPEVWELPLGTAADWRPLATAGTAPAGVSEANVVYDPPRQRVLVYGAVRWEADVPFVVGDVWALTLSGTPTWSLAVPQASGMTPRTAGTLVYDPVRDRMLLFGGTVSPDLSGDTGFRNELYQLELSGTPAWSRLVPDPSLVPPPVIGQTMVYDPVRDRMLMYGGYARTGEMNDTWSLSLGASPSWAILPFAGSPPFQGVAVSAIYDPLRDRVILLGGTDFFVGGWPSSQITALSLKYGPAWVPLNPNGLAPPPIQRHVAVYDPVADRMIVAGGTTYDQPPETYALSLAGGAWLTAYGLSHGGVVRTPDADWYPVGSEVTLSAVPDTGYVFARWSGDATGTASRIAVTMDGSKTIAAEFKPDVVPNWIQRFAARRDAAGVRIEWVLSGASEVRSVSVERAESEVGPWIALPLPAHSDGDAHVAVDDGAAPDRAWYYRLGVTLTDGSLVQSPASRVDAQVTRSGLESVAPNPSAAVRVAFALAREAPVRVSVLDVQGREVAVLASGVRPAGSHTVEWGRGAAPGLYFVRFASGRVVETRRIAIVP